MSDSETFDDDDFGGFEEGVVVETVGDAVKNSKSIAALIEEIVPKVAIEQNDAESVFKLDERSQKLFDTLLNTEDYPIQQMMWKKSMILKQLFLNLDIPVVENTFEAHQNHWEMGLEYDLQREEDIVVEVPSFDVLGLEESEFNDLLANTDVLLASIQDMRDKGMANAEACALTETRQRLVKTLSAWNKHHEALKADNELFTSYIDNLVGNTQKFRRQNK